MYLTVATKMAIVRPVTTPLAALSDISRTAGGGGYMPLAMTFESGDYYETFSNSQNESLYVTFVARFRHTGNYGAIIDYVQGNNYPRIELRIRGDDDKIWVRIFDNGGGTVCNLKGKTLVSGDGLWHSVYFNYDGVAGTTVLELDGVDEDDATYPSRVLTTAASLPWGFGNMEFNVGISNNGDWPWIGDLSFIGLHDVIRASSNFFDGSGNPIEQDEVTWTGWGTQPLAWSSVGQLDGTNNEGFQANIDVVGTPTGPA